MKTWKHTAVLLLVIILLAVTLVAHASAAGTEAPAQKEKAPIVWIVLFGVSLLGNIVQLVLMVWKKKDNRKQQIDDVPLVDYDIDDDVV